MFPWRACLVVAFTLCETVMAAPRMVFMQERGGEKQIVLTDADGNDARILTSGPLWHLYPALDGTGMKVAYVQGPDQEHLQVVTQNLETGVVERWTSRPGMHLHPRFSGDGRYLVFSGPYGPEGRPQIAIIDLQKSRPLARIAPTPGPHSRREVPMEVIPAEVPCYFPAPSSDGSFVIFQRSLGKGKKDIVLWDRSTRHLRRLTDAQEQCMAPALSFDDRLIAYSRQVNNRWDIYLLNPFGKGEPIRVTQGPGRNLAPRFGPDGCLLFASDRTGRFQLYRIRAAAMIARRFAAELLVGGNADFYAPSVSGDVPWSQEQLPAMPAPARSSFGVVRIGQRIYVAGGHQGHEHTYPPESFLAVLTYFDLDTRRWYQATSRSVPCHGFGLAAVRKKVDGVEKDFLYAFGGFAFSGDYNPRWRSLDLIERYDVQADRWEVIGRMPRPRSSNVVAQVGTRVYLIGGWDSTPRFNNDTEGQFLREIDVFDLETEVCSTSRYLLPDPLRRAFSSVVLGDEIILVGGLGQGSAHFKLLDNVTAFNPSTGRWRELPRLPFATFAPAAGVMGEELFVFGGMFKTGPQDYAYVRHVFSLKPGSDRWLHTGRYLAEAKGFAMVVPLSSQALGILGGHSYQKDTDGPVRTFEVFRRALPSESRLGPIRLSAVRSDTRSH